MPANGVRLTQVYSNGRSFAGKRSYNITAPNWWWPCVFCVESTQNPAPSGSTSPAPFRSLVNKDFYTHFIHNLHTEKGLAFESFALYLVPLIQKDPIYSI